MEGHKISCSLQIAGQNTSSSSQFSGQCTGHTSPLKSRCSSTQRSGFLHPSSSTPPGQLTWLGGQIVGQSAVSAQYSPWSLVVLSTHSTFSLHPRGPSLAGHNTSSGGHVCGHP